jgi:cell division protein FtsQ
MKIYNELVRQLDSAGGRYSQSLSEVDLSDPEDVKVLTNDSDGGVLIHLGSSNYLDRFKIYVAHLREWRQQFDKLESVDLRYDRQIIVNPDLRGAARQPALSATATKVAISAGVKPAALLHREMNKYPAPHQAVIKSTTSKHAEKQARWRKRNSVPKRATAKPVQHPALVAHKTVPSIQKPSPAIQKGQGNR